jgi:hypothetical protein
MSTTQSAVVADVLVIVTFTTRLSGLASRMSPVSVDVITNALAVGTNAVNAAAARKALTLPLCNIFILDGTPMKTGALVNNFLNFINNLRRIR